VRVRFCRGITSTCWSTGQTSRRPPSAACWSGELDGIASAHVEELSAALPGVRGGDGVAGLLSCWVVGFSGFARLARFSGSRAWNVARAATEARKTPARGESVARGHGPSSGHSATFSPLVAGEKGNKLDSWLRGHAANGNAWQERDRGDWSASVSRHVRARAPLLRCCCRGGFLAGRIGISEGRRSMTITSSGITGNVRQSVSSRKRDAILGAVRPALVAARCNPRRSPTSTRRGVMHSSSQHDQHSSQHDALLVAARPALVAA